MSSGGPAAHDGRWVAHVHGSGIGPTGAAVRGCGRGSWPGRCSGTGRVGCSGPRWPRSRMRGPSGWPSTAPRSRGIRVGAAATAGWTWSRARTTSGSCPGRCRRSGPGTGPGRGWPNGGPRTGGVGAAVRVWSISSQTAFGERSGVHAVGSIAPIALPAAGSIRAVPDRPAGRRVLGPDVRYRVRTAAVRPPPSRRPRCVQCRRPNPVTGLARLEHLRADVVLTVEEAAYQRTVEFPEDRATGRALDPCPLDAGAERPGSCRAGHSYADAPRRGPTLLSAIHVDVVEPGLSSLCVDLLVVLREEPDAQGECG